MRARPVMVSGRYSPRYAGGARRRSPPPARAATLLLGKLGDVDSDQGASLKQRKRPMELPKCQQYSDSQRQPGVYPLSHKPECRDS